MIIGGATIALLRSIQVGSIKTGFSSDKTITKSERRDQQGKVIETTTTTTFQDAKTLWDWLSLLGVPFSLAVLGYVLQQLQQARADEQANVERSRAAQQTKVEKEIAETNQREEALQNYLDRLSELLIDKNLIATAVKLQADTENQADKPSHLIALEEKELLNAAIDVIRARTLSILRRLGQDGERKGDVVRFLIEAEVISKLNLALSGTNFSGADLKYIDFSGVNLDGANFTSANLNGANLRNASLCDANFSGAALSCADFTSADLNSANLSSANLSSTSLNDANLCYANLCYANLNSAGLRHADLNCAKLRDADLTYADLRDADLTYADLTRANLSHTNLTCTNLRESTLGSANLSNVTLGGAIIDCTNFSDTDLHSIREWTEVKLAGARLCRTKLPEGCNLDPNRDCELWGISTEPPEQNSLQ